jgi:hypothetical protein
MEALAARDGLLLAVGVGFRDVILEMDNAGLVNLLKTQDGARPVIAGIWQEIQEHNRAFRSLCLCFCRRKANYAAHCCAKATNASNPYCNWMNCTPDHLQETVINDCNPAMTE